MSQKKLSKMAIFDTFDPRNTTFTVCKTTKIYTHVHWDALSMHTQKSRILEKFRVTQKWLKLKIFESEKF